MENKDIIILILGIIIISLGIYSSYIRDTSLKDFPLLDVQIIGLYENLYDSSEMFYDYWLFNYGDSEVKEVVVTCKLFDINENLISSSSEKFGNVASNSAIFGELITDNIEYDSDEEGVAICYVESCDNCDILYKKIPELTELYEK